MENSWIEPLKKIAWKIAVLLVLVWLFFKIPNTLYVFGTGLILYLLFDPLVDYFQKFIRRRGLAVLAVMLAVLLVAVIYFSLIMPVIVNDLSGLTGKWPEYFKKSETLVNYLTGRLNHLAARLGPEWGVQIQARINEEASRMGQYVFKFLESSVNFSFSLLSRMLGFLLALIVAIYLMADENKIKNGLRDILKLSPENSERFQLIIKKVNRAVTGYLIGVLCLSLLTFVLTWIYLAWANLPFSFLLSFWMGITQFIPYLGPFLGAMPLLGIAYLTGESTGNVTLIFLLVSQFMVANVLAPKIFGKNLNLHPLVVFFALLAGGEMFGMIGLFLAVPVAAVAVSVAQIFRNPEKN